MAKGYMFWDSETANSQQRICQAAYILTDSEGSPIREAVCELVDPESDFFWANVNVHGIEAADVVGKPNFAQFAKNHGLLDLLKDYIFVAHNANGADIHHIRKSLAAYGIEMPSFEAIDTQQVAQARGLPGSLDGLCGHYGIILEGHHDALNDVKVCASVFWKLVTEFGPLEPDEWTFGKTVVSRKCSSVFCGLGLVNASDRTVESVLKEAEERGFRGNAYEIEELAGLKVKISGVAPGYNRKTVLAELKSHGVKASEGVPGRSVAYLAIGDNVGQSKLDAVFNGDTQAKIITTGELLEVVNKRSRG